MEQAEPLNLECQHFLECLAYRKTPRTDGREGLRVLRVLQRAQEGLGSPMSATGAPSRASGRSIPGVQIHESAYIDNEVEIGDGTPIWHFTHILPRVRLGENCTVRPNVVIGPDVFIGDNFNIHNN